jgi:hypothetical protein
MALEYVIEASAGIMGSGAGAVDFPLDTVTDHRRQRRITAHVFEAMASAPNSSSLSPSHEIVQMINIAQTPHRLVNITAPKCLPLALILSGVFHIAEIVEASEQRKHNAISQAYPESGTTSR